MIGVQLSQSAAPFVQKLLDEGVVANATADTVLRLLPPLNTSREKMELVIDRLDKILKQTD